MRRHKLVYLTSSIVLMSLIVGMIGTTIGLVLANRSRAQAEQARAESELRRERTRDALDMMSGKMLDEWLLTSPELTDKQKVFLRDVMVYYEEFGNESTETEDGKISVAKASQRLAIIHLELGDKRESLERHQTAIEILESVKQSDQEVERLRAFSFQSVGEIYLSYGDNSNAQTYLSRARIALKDLCQEHNDDVEAHRLLSRQYYLDAKLRRQNGEYRYGLQLLEEARQALNSLVVRFPDDAVIEYSLVSTLQQLANDYRFNNREDEVAELYLEAIRRLRNMIADDPTNRQFRSRLAVCINDLGVFYKSNRQFEQALSRYEEAAGIRNQLRYQFPNSIETATSLAGTYINLGHIKLLQGNFSEADAYCEQGVELCLWVTDRSPNHVRTGRFLRNAREGQGESHLLTHQYASAVAAFEEAIDIHNATPSGESTGIEPRLILRRATALARMGRWQESLEVIEQAVATTEEDINADGAEKYHAALAYAAVIEATADDENVEDADRDRWATKAIEMLSIAISYNRAESPARMTEWIDDPELDCLRDHPGFAELVRIEDAEAQESESD